MIHTPPLHCLLIHTPLHCVMIHAPLCDPRPHPTYLPLAAALVCCPQLREALSVVVVAARSWGKSLLETGPIEGEATS